MDTEKETVAYTLIVTKEEAGWLMYALGLATGHAAPRSAKEIMRLTNAIADQLPRSLA